MVKEREILEDDRCLILMEFKALDLLSSDVFLVGEQKMKDAFLMASPMFKGIINEMWIAETKMFEFNQVVYYNGDKAELGTA